MPFGVVFTDSWGPSVSCQGSLFIMYFSIQLLHWGPVLKLCLQGPCGIKSFMVSAVCVHNTLWSSGGIGKYSLSPFSKEPWLQIYGSSCLILSCGLHWCSWPDEQWTVWGKNSRTCVKIFPETFFSSVCLLLFTSLLRPAGVMCRVKVLFPLIQGLRLNHHILDYFIWRLKPGRAVTFDDTKHLEHFNNKVQCSITVQTWKGLIKMKTCRGRHFKMDSVELVNWWILSSSVGLIGLATAEVHVVVKWDQSRHWH